MTLLRPDYPAGLTFLQILSLRGMHKKNISTKIVPRIVINKAASNIFPNVIFLGKYLCICPSIYEKVVIVKIGQEQVIHPH